MQHRRPCFSKSGGVGLGGSVRDIGAGDIG